MLYLLIFIRALIYAGVRYFGRGKTPILYFILHPKNFSKKWKLGRSNAIVRATRWIVQKKLPNEFSQKKIFNERLNKVLRLRFEIIEANLLISKIRIIMKDSISEVRPIVTNGKTKETRTIRIANASELHKMADKDGEKSWNENWGRIEKEQLATQ